MPPQPATINYQALNFYFGLFQFFFTAAIGVYVWWSNREKVTSTRFSALEKEVAERLKKDDLETAKATRDKQCVEHKGQTKDLTKAYADLHIEVTRLPDRREITKLDGTMKELARAINTLEGRFDGVNRAVDLINEFLIEQGGKK